MSVDANASISDSTGSLLFSFNGEQIWNSNGQVMMNGHDIIGHVSASQGALILQKPGSNHLYYLFTVSSHYIAPIGIHFSVVDMSLDGGLGAVTGEKNISIDIAWDAMDKLTSVRHANGKDIWVITRKFREDAYASFLLTSSGISLEAVIRPAPDRIENWTEGNLKVSPNKKYLVLSIENSSAANHLDQSFEVCSFNAQTGEVNLLYTITKNGDAGFSQFEPWATEFSPDSKLLYLTYWCNIHDSMELYQYDMQYVLDSLQFFESEIFIARGPVNGLQLARDGKIYCTVYRAWSYDYISVIHEPWNRGADCKYEADLINMDGDRVYRFLPNILLDHLYRFEWDGECAGNPIAFQPNFIRNQHPYFGVLGMEIFQQLCGRCIFMNRKVNTKCLYGLPTPVVVWKKPQG